MFTRQKRFNKGDVQDKSRPEFDIILGLALSLGFFSSLFF